MASRRAFNTRGSCVPEMHYMVDTGPVCTEPPESASEFLVAAEGIATEIGVPCVVNGSPSGGTNVAPARGARAAARGAREAQR